MSNIETDVAVKIMQATVNQALMDAVRHPPVDGEASMLKAVHQIRDEARKWLLSGGRDFDLVVTLAQYDPANIRDRVKRLAAGGWIPTHNRHKARIGPTAAQ